MRFSDLSSPSHHAHVCLMLIEKPKLASPDIGATKEMPLHIGSSSVEEFTLSDSDPIDIGVEDVGRLIDYGSQRYSW